jgi:RimJ/RimL family protein N-acetyltransferase
MPPTPVIETPRLILRELTLADLDALAVLYADPDIRRYFPEGTLTREETKEEIEWIIDVYYGQYGYGLWATIYKETGAFIGRCGLIPWKHDEGLEVEVAYLLDKPYWGRGLASEAALAIRDYGFEQLGLPRLICMMYPDNVASVNIAKKMGMTLDREEHEPDGRLYWVYSKWNSTSSPSPSAPTSTTL